MDYFQIACWMSATIVILITVLDVCGKINISATQLGLIGVSIALIIMPFARKLKILGVEFERLTADKKEGKEE